MGQLARLDHALAPARAALDRDTFEAAWTQGAAMTPEDIVASALT